MFLDCWSSAMFWFFKTYMGPRFPAVDLDNAFRFLRCQGFSGIIPNERFRSVVSSNIRQGLKC